MRALLPSLLALALCSACAPTERGGEAPRVVSAWPLFWSRRGPDRAEVEALGPLAFARHSPEAASSGLRPLFTVHQDKAQGRRAWQFLYPLSYFRASDGGQAGRQYVFPLYYRSWRTAANGRPERVGVLFPFLWWGHSATGGPWCVVPFLGGVCKGLLGQDEIVHVSWLYNRARWRGYVQHHVLWPFFSWASDGAGHRSLRLWPLYGRAEQEGEWWNGFVLWPFVTYGRRAAGENAPAADYWMLWPLFGRARSADGRSGKVQVLWPFFLYGWNRDTGYREWRLPWPLVVGRRQGRVRATNVWPLWGRRSWEAGSESYVLWPLVHTRRVRGRNTELDDVKLFPFFTSSTSRRKAPPSERRFRLLWPLWRWRRAETAERWERRGNSLQFAWFASPESFDRTYNALLGLWEHAASSDGARATRLLWRMVRLEGGPGWRCGQVGPLVSWTRAGSLTRTSFLLGLVQTGMRGGQRGWRILFVPFGASLSDPLPPAAED